MGKRSQVLLRDERPKRELSETGVGDTRPGVSRGAKGPLHQEAPVPPRGVVKSLIPGGMKTRVRSAAPPLHR